MDIKIELNTYKDDDFSFSKEKRIVIENHWNQDYLVWIKVGDDERVLVSAKDLKSAIERCSGWNFI